MCMEIDLSYPGWPMEIHGISTRSCGRQFFSTLAQTCRNHADYGSCIDYALIIYSKHICIYTFAAMEILFRMTNAKLFNPSLCPLLCCVPVWAKQNNILCWCQLPAIQPMTCHAIKHSMPVVQAMACVELTSKAWSQPHALQSMACLAIDCMSWYHLHVCPAVACHLPNPTRLYHVRCLFPSTMSYSMSSVTL